MAKTRSAQDRELDAMKAIIQALDGLEVLNRSGRLARLTLGLRVTEPRQEQVEVIPLIQAHLRLALRFSPEPGR